HWSGARRKSASGSTWCATQRFCGCCQVVVCRRVVCSKACLLGEAAAHWGDEVGVCRGRRSTSPPFTGLGGPPPLLSRCGRSSLLEASPLINVQEGRSH